MERLIVHSGNIEEIRYKISTILEDNSEILQNIDFEIGDKFVWNQESKIMTIMWADGKLKFWIRLLPETKEESDKNAQLAKEMQEWWIRENNENLEMRAKILGDWIVRRGAWPGKNNSCGASCGSLLNQFGFSRILPQSGRDGYRWGGILERNPVSQYFEKIPVRHPDDAPAWSILVFGKNAQLGSRKRRDYWHVEIKGSDNMYYSYYKSVNAAGSSRTTEKNPERYKRLTGFTGYAYVYNGKNPPR